MVGAHLKQPHHCVQEVLIEQLDLPRQGMGEGIGKDAVIVVVVVLKTCIQ